MGWGHISLSENIKNLNSTQSKIKFQISRQKKTILKNSVDSFVQQANAIVQKSEASFERRIKKNRVDTAYNISHRIYHENKDTLSSAEIKQRVKSVVASMVFGNDYMFIFDTSGMNILSPLLPHLEGVNALNMQDAEGNYTTRNAIKVVEERNAGFF